MPVDQKFAWIDESVNVSARVYILVAVIAADSRLDQSRAQMRGFLRGRRLRLHWREMSAKQQFEVAAAVGGLHVSAIVVVATNLDPRRQERARRKCLERLAPKLEQRGVATAWVESRGGVADKRDIKMIDALRTRGIIGSSLRIGFEPASADPMLWIADAVAGAISLAHTGSAVSLSALQHIIEQLQIDL